MADFTTDAPDLDAQEIAALRRQKVADLLMQQSMQPVQPFSQAGKLVAPMHWTQGLAQIAQALVAAKKGKAAESQLSGISDKRKQVADAAMDKFRRDSLGGMQTLPGTGAQLDTLPDPEGAAIELAGNPNVPQASRDAGMMQYKVGVDRQNRQDTLMNNLQERELQLKGLLANTALQGQQRADIAKQHDDTMRAIAAMRPAPQEPAPTAGEVVDPKDPTRMLKVNLREYNGGSLGDPGVYGIAGKEPASAKAAETRGTGKGAVSSLVSDMGRLYDELDKGGGIVDTRSSGASNLINKLQSSDVGQYVGGALGTENQQNRDTIKSYRTQLVNAIRQATGMSAKAMDSNTELKLYLESATDPSKGLQANKAALAKIDELYGEGSGAASAAPAAGAARPPPAGVDPNVWSHMTPEEQALWP